MILETERLILRPWEEKDANDLFQYASNPEVGPVAGWPVHTSIENSREIIKSYFSAPEIYAIVLKETLQPVGSIGLMIGSVSDKGIPDTEAEIGYWIGVPYWGQGLIPEAVREIMRHGFNDLNFEKMWCGYFDGNTKWVPLSSYKREGSVCIGRCSSYRTYNLSLKGRVDFV